MRSRNKVNDTLIDYSSSDIEKEQLVTNRLRRFLSRVFIPYFNGLGSYNNVHWLTLIVFWLFITLQWFTFVSDKYLDFDFTTQSGKIFMKICKFVTFFPISQIDAYILSSVVVALTVILTLLGTLLLYLYNYVFMHTLTKYVYMWVFKPLFVPLIAPHIQLLFGCVTFSPKSSTRHPFYKMTCFDLTHSLLMAVSCLCVLLLLLLLRLNTQLNYNSDFPIASQYRKNNLASRISSISVYYHSLAYVFCMALFVTAGRADSWRIPLSIILIIVGFISLSLVLNEFSHWQDFTMTVYVWQSLCIIVIGFLACSLTILHDTDAITTVFYFALPLLFIMAYVMVQWRYSVFNAFTDKDYTSAHLVILKVKSLIREYNQYIHRFGDVWIDLEQSQPKMLDTIDIASSVLNLGLERFPTSCDLHLFAASFYHEVVNNRVLCYRELDKAQTMDPNLVQKCRLFRLKNVLDSESLKQQSAEVSMFLEFKSKHHVFMTSLLVSLDKLVIMWTELIKSKPNVDKLTQVGEEAQHHLDLTLKNYEALLEINDSNLHLLRLGVVLYGLVMSDLSRAKDIENDISAIVTMKSKIIHDIHYNEYLNDVNIKLDIFDEEMGVVVIDINDGGSIESVNNGFLQLFSFTNSHELIGKNINIIIPEPVSSNHSQYLADFIHNKTNYTSRVLNNTRLVLGLNNHTKFLTPVAMYCRYSDDVRGKIVSVMQEIMNKDEIVLLGLPLSSQDVSARNKSKKLKSILFRQKSSKNWKDDENHDLKDYSIKHASKTLTTLFGFSKRDIVGERLTFNNIFENMVLITDKNRYPNYDLNINECIDPFDLSSIYGFAVSEMEVVKNIEDIHNSLVNNQDPLVYMKHASSSKVMRVRLKKIKYDSYGSEYVLLFANVLEYYSDNLAEASLHSNSNINDSYRDSDNIPDVAQSYDDFPSLESKKSSKYLKNNDYSPDNEYDDKDRRFQSNFSPRNNREKDSQSNGDRKGRLNVYDSDSNASMSRTNSLYQGSMATPRSMHRTNNQFGSQFSNDTPRSSRGSGSRGSGRGSSNVSVNVNDTPRSSRGSGSVSGRKDKGSGRGSDGKDDRRGTFNRNNMNRNDPNNNQTKMALYIEDSDNDSSSDNSDSDRDRDENRNGSFKRSQRRPHSPFPTTDRYYKPQHHLININNDSEDESESESDSDSDHLAHEGGDDFQSFSPSISRGSTQSRSAKPLNIRDRHRDRDVDHNRDRDRDRDDDNRDEIEGSHDQYISQVRNQKQKGSKHRQSNSISLSSLSPRSHSRNLSNPYDYSPNPTNYSTSSSPSNSPPFNPLRSSTRQNQPTYPNHNRPSSSFTASSHKNQPPLSNVSSPSHKSSRNSRLSSESRRHRENNDHRGSLSQKAKEKSYNDKKSRYPDSNLSSPRYTHDSPLDYHNDNYSPDSCQNSSSKKKKLKNKKNDNVLAAPPLPPLNLEHDQTESEASHYSFSVQSAQSNPVYSPTIQDTAVTTTSFNNYNSTSTLPPPNRAVTENKSNSNPNQDKTTTSHQYGDLAQSNYRPYPLRDIDPDTDPEYPSHLDHSDIDTHSLAASSSAPDSEGVSSLEVSRRSEKDQKKRLRKKVARGYKRLQMAIKNDTLHTQKTLTLLNLATNLLAFSGCILALVSFLMTNLTLNDVHLLIEELEQSTSREIYLTDALVNYQMMGLMYSIGPDHAFSDDMVALFYQKFTTGPTNQEPQFPVGSDFQSVFTGYVEKCIKYTTLAQNVNNLLSDINSMAKNSHLSTLSYDNIVPVSHLLVTGEIIKEYTNLNDAVNTWLSYVRYHLWTDDFLFNLNHWIIANVISDDGFRHYCRLNTQYTADYIDSQIQNLSLEAIIFCVISIGILLCIIVFFVAPSIIKVERTKNTVLQLFSGIPKNVRTRIRDRIVAAQSLVKSQMIDDTVNSVGSTSHLSYSESNMSSIGSAFSYNRSSKYSYSHTSHSSEMSYSHNSMSLANSIISSANSNVLTDKITTESLLKDDLLTSQSSFNQMPNSGQSQTSHSFFTDYTYYDDETSKNRGDVSETGTNYTSTTNMTSLSATSASSGQFSLYDSSKETETEYVSLSISDLLKRKILRQSILKYLMILLITTLYFVLALVHSRAIENKMINASWNLRVAQRRPISINLAYILGFHNLLIDVDHSGIYTDPNFVINMPSPYDHSIPGNGIDPNSWSIYLTDGPFSENGERFLEQFRQEDHMIVFGSTEDGITPIPNLKNLDIISYRSICDYSHEQIEWMLPTVVTRYYLVDHCHEYNNTMSRGLDSALRWIDDLLSIALDKQNAGHLRQYVNYSPHPVPDKERVDFLYTTLQTLNTAYFDFIYPMLRLSSIIYKFSLFELLLIHYTLEIIMISVFIVAVILTYYFILAPISEELGTSAEKTKSLLMLLPPEVIQYVSGVQHYINDNLKN